jgi:hypothetical protein
VCTAFTRRPAVKPAVFTAHHDNIAPMTVITRQRFAAITGLCAALIACGKHANDPSAATGSGVAAAAVAPGAAGRRAAPADPCSLLTIAEASAALGGPAASKVEATKDATLYPDLKVTEKTCSFALITSDQLGHDIYVSVYEAVDLNYFSQATGHSPAIAGLGDAAFGDAREVFVFSKGTMVHVYGSLPNNEGTAADGIEKIARLAIAKL